MNENNNIEDPNVEDEVLQGAIFDGGDESVENIENESAEEKQETTDDANAGGKDAEIEETKTPTHQEKIDHAFIRLKSELKESQAKREKEQAEFDNLKKEYEKLLAPKRPEVPPMPDTWDVDYEKKIEERDLKLRQQAEFDRLEKEKERSIVANQEKQLINRVQDIKTMQDSYVKRARELKLDTNELKTIEDKLTPFINDATAPTAEYILSHKDGPLITQFIGANAEAFDKVTSLNPIHAAVYIETQIAPKLGDFNKINDDPPKPIDTFEGKGKIIDDFPELEGATFS
jgi:hypothetical protein